MNINWRTFTIIGFFMYLYHIIFTIAGVNNFTDITRFSNCGNQNIKNSEQASSLMDFPIALSTSFHMIEWLRWTLFLTSILVDTNQIKTFNYIALFSIPFGVLALLISIISRYSQEEII